MGLCDCAKVIFGGGVPTERSGEGGLCDFLTYLNLCGWKIWTGCVCCVNDHFQVCWIFDIRIIFVYALYVNFQKYYPATHYPNIPPPNFYTYFIFHRGVPLSTSDSNPIVCSTPKPCGIHFRRTHYLAHTMQFLEIPSTLKPLAIQFPKIHPQIFTPIP